MVVLIVFVLLLFVDCCAVFAGWWFDGFGWFGYVVLCVKLWCTMLGLRVLLLRFLVVWFWFGFIKFGVAVIACLFVLFGFVLCFGRCFSVGGAVFGFLWNLLACLFVFDCCLAVCLAGFVSCGRERGSVYTV